jgi:hypothetical protein
MKRHSRERPPSPNSPYSPSEHTPPTFSAAQVSTQFVLSKTPRRVRGEAHLPTSHPRVADERFDGTSWSGLPPNMISQLEMLNKEIREAAEEEKLELISPAEIGTAKI